MKRKIHVRCPYCGIDFVTDAIDKEYLCLHCDDPNRFEVGCNKVFCIWVAFMPEITYYTMQELNDDNNPAPGAYRQYTTLAEAEQTGASTCWTYQTSK